jgi:hypothetical protein
MTNSSIVVVSFSIFVMTLDYLIFVAFLSSVRFKDGVKIIDISTHFHFLP